MLKQTVFPLLVAITFAILPGLSTSVGADAHDFVRGNSSGFVTGDAFHFASACASDFASARPSERSSVPAVGLPATGARGVPASRFARLRRGINLSHWFSQSNGNDYSPTHLETHTTAADIALIKRLGFDHVRLPIEPAPLFNPSDPGALDAEYLRRLDHALDMILAGGLAVVVDIHPSDEFKRQLNDDDRHVEAFAAFWRALAHHLSTRDPERVFLEVLNEPVVEDGYRWAGIQAKLVAAIRAAAPRHTIIATGHRWSGLSELLFLEPLPDANVVYNFHFYEPMEFTHQGATWAGPHLSFFKDVPYPSSPEAVAKVSNAVADEPARLHLSRYGEDRWDAARIETKVAAAALWAERHHVRLTCNEFGVYRRVAPAADRARWIQDVREALERHQIGWAMWDYAGGFAVADKTNGHAAVPDAGTVAALGLSERGRPGRSHTRSARTVTRASHTRSHARRTISVD
jgi:aryl-phospho-beta-D-glucosidase BglC (GH1 family)